MLAAENEYRKELIECYHESREINQLLHEAWCIAHVHTCTNAGKKANNLLQNTLESFSKLNDHYYYLYWKEFGAV